MREINAIQSDELPLTDELVSAYLLDNPEFFNRHPELLASLRLQDKQRGVVSLVERQQQHLRQKMYALEEEVTQLMSVAQHNEQLFAVYSDLYLRLIDCHSATDLLDCLHKTTTELLSLVGFKLWLVEPASIVHHAYLPHDCSAVLLKRLEQDDYYFGRLQKDEQQLIFPEHNDGSVVLIKLRHADKILGFIAIGSYDAEHFDPRMDTLLLTQFRKLVAQLLNQRLNQSFNL